MGFRYSTARGNVWGLSGLLNSVGSLCYGVCSKRDNWILNNGTTAGPWWQAVLSSTASEYGPYLLVRPMITSRNHRYGPWAPAKRCDCDPSAHYYYYYYYYYTVDNARVVHKVKNRKCALRHGSAVNTCLYSSVFNRRLKAALRWVLSSKYVWPRV